MGGVGGTVEVTECEAGFGEGGVVEHAVSGLSVAKELQPAHQLGLCPVRTFELQPGPAGVGGEDSLTDPVGPARVRCSPAFGVGGGGFVQGLRTGCGVPELGMGARLAGGEQGVDATGARAARSLAGCADQT